VEIPRGIFGKEAVIVKQLERAAADGAEFALCNTIGAIPLAKAAGLAPLAGAFLHMTNSDTLSALAEDGAVAATLSFELTFPQMRFAENRGCVGLFAYGRQPLMLLRACPISANIGCLSCGGSHALTDRRDTAFPVRCAGECSELLNSVPLYLADALSQLPPHSFLYLHFTDEAPARISRVLEQYRIGGKPPSGFTRGLYKRGVL
jgi:putative protease